MSAVFRHLWIAALTAVCGVHARATQPIDIVFDLDWTLFSTIPADQKLTNLTGVTTVNGIRYRLADGVVETLNLLRRFPHVRISVFSGGESTRNETLLRSVILDPKGPLTAYDILYEKLSFTDLSATDPLPDLGRPLKFSERWRKNLEPRFPNLSRTILIEDSRAFATSGQERNLYWVGPTYDFFETYADVERARKAAIDSTYIPPSFEAWEIERHRIPTTGLLLEDAIQADLDPDSVARPWVERVQEIEAQVPRSKRLVHWKTRLPLLQGRCDAYVQQRAP